jgi:hypothetical protein
MRVIFNVGYMLKLYYICNIFENIQIRFFILLKIVNCIIYLLLYNHFILFFINVKIFNHV